MQILFISINLGTFLCGGTLIDQYTVLTAGHCVVTSFTAKVNGISQTFTVSNPYDGSQYTVYVGVNNSTFWKLGSLYSLNSN
jgi:V8-like Glu-specific endopeptidase